MNFNPTAHHYIYFTTLLEQLNISLDEVYSASNKQSLLDVVTPISNEQLCSIPTANYSDYEQIIKNSQEAFEQWKNVPAPKRGEFVRVLGEKFREYKNQLGGIIALEMGKSIQEGWGEVQEMIDVADYAVGQSRMLHGMTMHSERPHHRMYEQWHPYGVVGVVTAFNFPMAVWAWNALVAAACGDTVIWKPSSKTPLCAIAVTAICKRAARDLGVPDIFHLFISNDHSVAGNLINDHRVPLISFTGSSAMGKQVASQVGMRMGRTLLECSGNNAMILTESANLNIAIPAIVFGATGTTGQRCTSTRRLFIHEAIYDTVISKLIKAYKQLNIGNPLDPTMHVGPLIDQRAVVAYNAAITNIRSVDITVIFDAESYEKGVPTVGNFVVPTIIEVPTMNIEQVKQEVFAPILYVTKFTDLNEAIRDQNDVSQGLSSSIFTENMKQAELFLSINGSDCGIANVNIGTSGAEVGGGFGGHKDTGNNNDTEAGPESWKAYMRRQVCTINYGDTLPLAQGIKFDV